MAILRWAFTWGGSKSESAYAQEMRLREPPPCGALALLFRMMRSKRFMEPGQPGSRESTSKNLKTKTIAWIGQRGGCTGSAP